MVGLKAAMQAKAWAKYGLSARMSPVTTSTTHRCVSIELDCWNFIN
jgi:hypothetical protein